MNKIFCLVLFILGTFFLFAGLGLMFGESDTAIKLIAQTPVFSPPISQAPLSPQKIIDLVNNTRSDLGLKPLERDPALDFIAYIRAENIMANGDFSHEATRSSGLTYNKIADRLLTQYQSIGENLALGDFDGEEQTLVNMWLDSSHHKEILLGNYNKVGVFTRNGNFNGVPNIVTVWITAKE